MKKQKNATFFRSAPETLFLTLCLHLLF